MNRQHGQRQDHSSSHPSERQNEYFIPGDGISREVIQADICRYLGNDALVRPGTYQGRQGYFIRAYRNLTTEMIADLKEDSRRWASERSQMQQMGYGSAPSYLSSNVHDERQQLGPTPGPMHNNPPMAQPQYGQTYGNTQTMNQPSYGNQPSYSSADSYPTQAYTYTSAPSSTYPPAGSVSSYSYDSNYPQQQQPRTAPHTYDNPQSTSGYSYPSNDEYQSSSGYYPGQTGIPSSQSQYAPGLQPQAPGYAPSRDPGFNPETRASTAHVRQNTSSREPQRRDPPRRGHH